MVHGLGAAIGLSLALLLANTSALATCHFISLREFHVAEPADPFGMGDFVPLIALEAGRYYPLAPEGEAEAAVGERIEGRRYYLPRHLIDRAGRLSLRIMMIDMDRDTPADLVLPPSERSVLLADREREAGSHLVTVRFKPFRDEVRMQSNAQSFTFEISERAGPCDADTDHGRAADRHNRRDNDLNRLRARVMFHDQPYPVGGREYLAYRTRKISDSRLPLALARAFDVARVNGRELIALGEEIRALHGVSGYAQLWADYARLVRRLAAQEIPLLYRDEKRTVKRTSAPSLAFHPAWRKHRDTDKIPMLPKAWGIILPGR